LIFGRDHQCRDRFVAREVYFVIRERCGLDVVNSTASAYRCGICSRGEKSEYIMHVAEKAPLVQMLDTLQEERVDCEQERVD